jgi:hypothetical protein
MAWHWTYAGVAETQSQDFPSQAEAEAWLGDEWRNLLDRGVDAVTLTEDGREVYGPMPLTPA